MNNDIQNIKSRLNIVDLVSEYVELKRAGANYKGRCPFHNEKTPSFMVSEEKQIFHCFGCSAGGDIYKFLQQIEGLEFGDALRILAKRAGVELQSYKGSRKDKGEYGRVIEALAYASKLYEYLYTKEGAQHARDYIASRGVTDESVRKFLIGYSPKGWDTMVKILRQKMKATDHELMQAGLVIKRKSGEGIFDRFRNRLMFAIRNLNGDVVGFGGRVLDPEDTGGKYMNSPQCLVYNKSEIVYGLYEARQAIRTQDIALVVEGYLDVITCHEYGFDTAVASSGTALTTQQLKKIKRYTKNIYFCFDGDGAGLAALRRASLHALQEGLSPHVIVIPAELGKDPDDVLRKHGKQKWQECIDNARPVLEHYLNTLRHNFNLQNLADKSNAAQSYFELLGVVPDQIVQAGWLEKLASLLGLSSQVIKESFAQYLLEKNKYYMRPPDESKYPALPIKNVKTDKLAEKYFSLIFFQPLLFPDSLEVVESDYFLGPQFQELYKAVNMYYTDNNFSLPLDSKGRLDNQIFIGWAQTKNDLSDLSETIRPLLLLGESEYGSLDPISIRDEFGRTLAYLKRRFIKIEIQKVAELIKDESDPQKVTDLLKKVQKMQQKLGE
jgi:DNA primase